MDEKSLNTIAEFLSTDIVKKHDSQLTEKRSSVSISTSTKSPTHTTSSAGANKDGEAPTKEGYLTKRGKNFGGWQARYFVLDGPQLKYFDAVCHSNNGANISQTEYISVVSNYLKHRLVGRLLNLKQRLTILMRNR